MAKVKNYNEILEKILSDSWTLKHDDKDMIVMYHKRTLSF